MVLVSGEIDDVSILLLNDLINIPFEELEKPV